MVPLPTRYSLKSLVSKQVFPDDDWLLDAPGETVPGLLQSVYAKSRLELIDEFPGIYKYAHWLPVRRILEGSSAPVTYKSAGLADYLGLENLYITFSGYWPEKSAWMKTCSFKETEAYSVCARLAPENHRRLVVASAGNTARAFATVCSDNDIPLLLCVPYDNLDALWFDTPLKDCVTLISPAPGCDYFDAIHLSNLVCQLDGYFPEGGAKNIARRDGMATTVLSAVQVIGRIPDIYFQAVGSGTGAIAAWEAAKRLRKDGRFGQHPMKLWLSQNSPFQPMVDAWNIRSRELPVMDDQIARELVMQIHAKVLSNRKPPYTIKGGLFDALVDTHGEVIAITNDESAQAAGLVERLEGIDIHPAAAVATASLIKAAQQRKIRKETVIMLNITGGGEIRYRQTLVNAFGLKPVTIFEADVTAEKVRKEMQRIG